VVLRAFLEWGEDCVEHLNGMFAFAVWEPRRQTLTLARDRVGIKRCTTREPRPVWCSGPR